MLLLRAEPEISRGSVVCRNECTTPYSRPTQKPANTVSDQAGPTHSKDRR